MKNFYKIGFIVASLICFYMTYLSWNTMEFACLAFLLAGLVYAGLAIAEFRTGVILN